MKNYLLLIVCAFIFSIYIQSQEKSDRFVIVKKRDTVNVWQSDIRLISGILFYNNTAELDIPKINNYLLFFPNFNNKLSYFNRKFLYFENYRVGLTGEIGINYISPYIKFGIQNRIFNQIYIDIHYGLTVLHKIEKNENNYSSHNWSFVPVIIPFKFIGVCAGFNYPFYKKLSFVFETGINRLEDNDIGEFPYIALGIGLTF